MKYGYGFKTYHGIISTHRTAQCNLQHLRTFQLILIWLGALTTFPPPFLLSYKMHKQGLNLYTELITQNIF